MPLGGYRGVIKPLSRQTI